MISFEWDAAKANPNKKKHGVSFEEAQSVFYDEFAVQFFDDESTELEDRFLMLGFSEEARLLIVCHCERNQGTLSELFQLEKPPKLRANITRELSHEN